MSKQILITKHSGEQEVFSTEKLVRSLRNAGADSDIIQTIVKDIERWLSPGVSTKAIYHRAHQMLHQMSETSFRYRLKQAIYELGPTGYPFEFLLGEIYKRQGWQVEVGQVLQGASVTHEMDVIATKDGIQYLIECKYHKDQGKQVSVQVPLYVRSRVNDIIEYRQPLDEFKAIDFVAGVATNTRFSDDSLHYGRHAKLSLLAWDYPKGEGLKDLVERYFIYPVTILRDLRPEDKRYLIDHQIILCYQLDENVEILKTMGMPSKQEKAVLKELAQIADATPYF